MAPDPDLEHLLKINGCLSTSYYSSSFFFIPNNSPSHSQWISNMLLHYSWAKRTKLSYQEVLWYTQAMRDAEHPMPLNVKLNFLLMWCTFLGSPVEEEVLKVQDKSYDTFRFYSSSCSLLFTSDRIEPIMYQLSKAVLSAINGPPTQRELIWPMLCNLINLETRPMCLTIVAYEWCSVICENRESLEDWESLLLACLEIGFRHLDFQCLYIGAEITHTEHHRGLLVDVVFEGQESEVIADLLQAWTAGSGSYEYGLIGSGAGHLVGLHKVVPFSPRLRRLIIRSVEIIGWKGFEGVGVEKFIELLNHLHVTVEDMDDQFAWATLLVDTIERNNHLSQWYWELLVELAITWSWRLGLDFAQGMQTITSLTEAKEWSKLECWMGIVWILSPQKANAMAEGDMGQSMLLLFRQRPGAVQKLEQWMERWDQREDVEIPESFKHICQQAHEATQQDAP